MNLVNTEINFSTSLLASMMNTMHEGMILFNRSGQAEALNDAAVKLLGLTDEADFLGKSVSTIFHSADAATAFFEQLRRHGNVPSTRGVFARGHNEMEVSYAAGSDNTKHGTTGFLLFRDVTGYKQIEEQLADYSNRLERKNKELDQFAYIISHDLKAPLRAISNLSVWLEEDLEGVLTSETQKNFELLKLRVARLEALINGVLEYSRIGRTEIHHETIDTTELLTEILDLLSPPQHIRFEISADLPVVTGPRILLAQVFSNLISNAIKYNNKPEGLVRIYAFNRGNVYEFIVEDNGPGIAPEFHDKIFQIFHTLQPRDKFESTGIGLAIVKRIVDEQDGRVWVESTVGAGSKFVFTWTKR